ncbi:coiled-coil domain-containing protein 136-like [Osmerus eperlanus]|uniref:coiled-coil domain-containing protein 136-like n=1 Tax=Osmerus eperlanus TaxID=29151 RepID=UPI002E163608
MGISYNGQSSHLLEHLCPSVSSSNAYLALREDKEAGGVQTTQGDQPPEVDSVKASGGYLTLSQALPDHQGPHLVDASIQKNMSFDGKPVDPGSWTGGPAELTSLKDQLSQAEERVSRVQSECEGLRGELHELQSLYDLSQQERAELEQELQRCKRELEKLVDRKSQNCPPPSEPPVLSIPFIGMIVIVALIWCWWEELAS